jgi:hypothetical protein
MVTGKLWRYYISFVVLVESTVNLMILITKWCLQTFVEITRCYGHWKTMAILRQFRCPGGIYCKFNDFDNQMVSTDIRRNHPMLCSYEKSRWYYKSFDTHVGMYCKLNAFNSQMVPRDICISFLMSYIYEKTMVIL